MFTLNSTNGDAIILATPQETIQLTGVRDAKHLENLFYNHKKQFHYGRDYVKIDVNNRQQVSNINGIMPSANVYRAYTDLGVKRFYNLLHNSGKKEAAQRIDMVFGEYLQSLETQQDTVDDTEMIRIIADQQETIKSLTKMLKESQNRNGKLTDIIIEHLHNK